MQYVDNMVFKLALGTTQIELHENVFRFDVVNRFTNVCDKINRGLLRYNPDQAAAEVNSSAKSSEEIIGKNYSYLQEYRVPHMNEL